MAKKRFISLRTKMLACLILICFLMGSLSVFSVNRIASSIVDIEYRNKAEQLAEAVANMIDPDDVIELKNAVLKVYDNVDEVIPSSEWGSDAWNEYMSHYEGIDRLPVFNRLREQLRVYQDIFKVSCIYITDYKTEVKHAIYLVDAAYEDACPPGVVDSFDDGIWPDKDNPIVPATLTNEEIYGWLYTAAYPVMKDGEVITHLCVDISVNEIKEKERNYFLMTVLTMVALTLGMIIFSSLYFDASVIRPVKKLSDTAKNYCSEANNMEHHAFENLKRKSNDEIGQLLSSMKQMEADMNSNIKEVIDAKVALKASQELASKDALTGVRNKTAYDYEVKRLEAEMEAGDCEFGLAMVDLNFLKKINDTYGHEKGNVSIKCLCSLVCEIFEHSPVFRVGGDEFVVVLRNGDYKNADRLIRKFNDRLEQIESDNILQPWEKISAAIGYHKYNKNVDRNVEVVFKKADDAMYKRKALMKAERKE